jgi:hypothetical protein
MSVQSTRIETSKLGKVIQFGDFDISWAGANPFGEGYCFGSEDGRFRILTTDGLGTLPEQVIPSCESVNGIAFVGWFMAVSTRCEVVFRDLDPRSSKNGTNTYKGGAHGILATSAGGFVAPLGVNGLLRVPEIGDTEVRFLVNAIRDNPNLYQLALLHGNGTRDFIAAAARKDGIYTFDLNSEINNGRPGPSVYFRDPRLDIVSLCSLGSRDWPYSLAGLGTDGSVLLFRDIQAKEQPARFRISNMLGSPYTILQSQGHLFVLTSEALYSCANIAKKFLAREINCGLDLAGVEELRAVDVYAVGDEILVEMADHVLIAKVDTLISETSSFRDESRNDSKLEPVNNNNTGTFSSAPIAA